MEVLLLALKETLLNMLLPKMFSLPRDTGCYCSIILDTSHSRSAWNMEEVKVNCIHSKPNI